MDKKIEAFFKGFQDADEQVTVRLANQTIGEIVPVIPTGSLLLDEALSSGGLPKGRIIQYYGPPGSGKSLMSMSAMAEAQKEDPDALQVFIDAEGTFVPGWAEALGVDTSRVLLIEEDLAVNGRKCFEMLLGTPKEDAKSHILVGKKQEGLLDKIVKKEININLIVLDSLGAIIPPGEDISAVGKMNMSLLARFLTTTFRKLSLEIKKANIPFVVINHKKDSMDMYTSHTFSGGNTYSHFLSANVYFEGLRGKDNTILNDKEEKIGHTIRATIEKSKFGPHPRKCEFKVNFSVGVVDRHEEVAQLALDYNIVHKPSSVSHEYGDRKWVGFPKFCEGIKEDPELMAELMQKINEARLAKLEALRAEQAPVVVEGEEKQTKTKKSKKSSE